MTNMLRCLFAACAGLFAVAASAPADAQALDRIIKEKKIRITAQVELGAVRDPRQGQQADRLRDRDRAPDR